MKSLQRMGKGHIIEIGNLMQGEFCLEEILDIGKQSEVDEL